MPTIVKQEKEEATALQQMTKHDRTEEMPTRWQNEYFFIEYKCICLICNEAVAPMKEHNVQRYYESKHQTHVSDTGAKQEQKVKQMTTSLQAQ